MTDPRRPDALATLLLNDALTAGGVRELPPDRNPAAVFLARLRAGPSRTSQLGALRALARLLWGPGASPRTAPWERLSYGTVVGLRSALRESGLSPATCRARFAALRGVLREAWHLGLYDGEEWQRVKDVEVDFGDGSPRPGRALSPEEITRLFEACPDTYAGRLDAAIVACLFYGGLRRFEAAALDLADLDLGPPGEFAADPPVMLIVRAGKGSKERRTPLGWRAIGILKDWMRYRGGEPGPLLCGLGAYRGQRLSSTTIRNRLARLARKANVARFSPHDLRRTFVTRLIEKTDLALAQRMAGHKQISTTIRYDKRGEQAKIDAAKLLD